MNSVVAPLVGVSQLYPRTRFVGMCTRIGLAENSSHSLAEFCENVKKGRCHSSVIAPCLHVRAKFVFVCNSVRAFCIRLYAQIGAPFSLRIYDVCRSPQCQ